MTAISYPKRIEVFIALSLYFSGGSSSPFLPQAPSARVAIRKINMVLGIFIILSIAAKIHTFINHYRDEMQFSVPKNEDLEVALRFQVH